MSMIKKIKNFKNHSVIMMYLNNTSWLLVDNVLKLIVALFVGVWVARYLGPEQFGIFSYVGSFVAIFASIATLGLDSIVIRELVKNENTNEDVLATAFALKVIGACFALFLLCIGILISSLSMEIKVIAFIMGFSFIFQTFNIINLYFQSIVKSKFVVMANMASVLISSIIKITLILFNAPLIDFAKIVLFDSFSLSVFLLYFFIKKTNFNLSDYSFKLTIAKGLLKDSWPLIFSAIAAVIKLKLGQIMLGNLGSFTDVGHYAAALRISELWFLIPVMLGSSIYPALIKAKSESLDLLKYRVLIITKVMFAFAVSFAIIISLLSDFLMTLLFGQDFIGAGAYLSLQIWSGLPYVTLFAYSQITYIVGKTKIHLYIAILAIATTVIFNLWLIPIFGGLGAVYSAILTACLGSCLMVYLIEKDVHIFTTGKKYV